jgi:hypothetical protein
MEMRAVRARNKKNMSKDFFIMISIHRAIRLIVKTKLGAMSWNFCQHLACHHEMHATPECVDFRAHLLISLRPKLNVPLD